MRLILADGEGARKVLIAEDDPALVETYELWSQQLNGIETQVEVNGRQALKRLSDEVDILICDRRMPELSGAELIDQIDTSNLTVIVISAYKPDDSLNESHVDHYIKKPIDFEDFQNALA